MNRKRFFLASAAGLLAAVAGASALASPAAAQEVAKSYVADSALQAGMIVRLADDKAKVAPLSQSDESRMFGVVVRPNDAPLSLSQGQAGQLVYVATHGTYRLLVSNQNGPLKQGDYVAVSSLDGIGAKVTAQAQYVIGKTVQGYDGSTTVLSETTIRDSAGHERTVKIGSVDVDINIGRNPLHKNADSPVPGSLQRVADLIAGKKVSAIRVFMSIAVIIIASVITCTILYAGVRASMIALGRNPLARKSILRNLMQIVLLALIILTIGLFAVYLLLRL